MLDTVVVRRRVDPDARLRLICLGFCGGGAASYLHWDPVMPPGVELASVCYPGREGRFAADYARDWTELSGDAVAAVRSAADLPFVLYGHSMGGWMAFEVAARLEREGGPLPEAVAVSSVNAPSRGLTERDKYPSQHDTDEQLIAWIRTHGVAAEHILGDPDLRELALELMRADLRVRDTFFHRPGTRLGVPLQVLTGLTDTVVVPEARAQWSELTTGPFRYDELPGGHFFTPEVWRELPGHIAALSRNHGCPTGVGH
ncbi:thioesterase II family protein [Herbidospora cretacea]|uniref:thioesterase II family protein n=1 Tax=Herbidospora cretacea TaxID=28444 RepID=UPI000774E5D2|nr:alpha/beta fold hydrolase [Herbidospora cretacea]